MEQVSFCWIRVWGECEECTVIVRANAITVGTYQIIRSTDFNGAVGDGVVNAADLSFFATAFNYTQFACADSNPGGCR
ncbi:MAG: hypothetical protein KJ927_08495 [Candidatus Eisenbacteria bacterium]|nr:hypothetical protein [Candidatus Eisenbacteria bacterium]MBU1948735.1 hypothetical protein [Candidatus Eisenbacteria bacterium]